MRRIYDRFCAVEVFVAKGLAVAIAALVLCSAIARTFHHPVNWAVDAAAFLFAWCVFLSGDIALREDRLVSIDLFVKKLPARVQFYVQIVNWILIIAFLAALVVFGLWLSYTIRFRTFQGIPGFSYTWVALSVPVGSMLMLITAILKVKDQFSTGGRRKEQRAA